jgi:hypothetical protein
LLLGFIPFAALKNYTFLSIWFCSTIAGIFSYYWCLLSWPSKYLNYHEILFPLPTLKLASGWIAVYNLLTPYLIHNFIDGYWYLAQYLVIMTVSFYILMIYVYYFPEIKNDVSFKIEDLFGEKLHSLVKMVKNLLDNRCIYIIKQNSICFHFIFGVGVITIMSILLFNILSQNIFQHKAQHGSSVSERFWDDNLINPLSPVFEDLQAIDNALHHISYGEIFFKKEDPNADQLKCLLFQEIAPNLCKIEYSYVQEIYDKKQSILKFLGNHMLKIVGTIFFIYGFAGYVFGNFIFYGFSIFFRVLCGINNYKRDYKIIQISEDPRSFALISYVMTLSVIFAMCITYLFHGTLSIDSLVHSDIYKFVSTYVTSGIILLIFLKTEKFGYAIRKSS